MVSKSKTKKKTSENIKRELLNLLKENDDVEEQNKENFLKSLRILKTFLIMSVKACRPYILKFCFISF